MNTTQLNTTTTTTSQPPPAAMENDALSQFLLNTSPPPLTRTPSAPTSTPPPQKTTPTKQTTPMKHDPFRTSPKTTVVASLPLPPFLDDPVEDTYHNNPSHARTASYQQRQQHKKASSLVGFDPLLQVDANSLSQNLSQVWSSDSVDKTHPLFQDDSSNNPSSQPPTVTMNRPPRKSRRARNTVCAADLRGIASQLSIDKPRKNTTMEERLMQNMMSRVTLGESIESSTTKSDRKLLHTRRHRKTHSAEDLLQKHISAPSTPEKHKHPKSPLLRVVRTPKKPSTTPPPSSPLHIPSLSKPSPTSFLKDSDTLALRSSEVEPSPHQLELTPPQQLYKEARLIALVNQCVQENVALEAFAGVSQSALQDFVKYQSPILGLVHQHHASIASVLCACDVVVEGVCETPTASVAVLANDSQIVLVFSGTEDSQTKPIRKSQTATAPLDQLHETALVYAPAQEAYASLEDTMVQLVDRLADANPFCRVHLCGHSFGGLLALLGGARLAAARTTLNFTVHAFGTPKVGTQDFRHHVHSLPNLRILRVELGSDSLIPRLPADAKWRHVGHSLCINNKSVVAYKFDNHKKSVPVVVGKLTSAMMRQKHQSEAQAYVTALADFSAGKQPWVKHYQGENGDGVVVDHESRNMT